MVNTVQPIEMVELKWSKSEMEVNVKQSFSEKEVSFMTKLVKEGFNIKDTCHCKGDDVAGMTVTGENDNMLVPMFKDGYELVGFLLEEASNSIIAYYADKNDQVKIYKLQLDLKRIFELLGLKSNIVKLKTDSNNVNGIIIIEVNFTEKTFLFDYVSDDVKYGDYTLIDDDLEKIISDELFNLNFKMLN